MIEFIDFLHFRIERKGWQFSPFKFLNFKKSINSYYSQRMLLYNKWKTLYEFMSLHD